MANYNTTANVVVTVNGRQAQKMLTTLEKDAKRLEKQIARAAAAGDKATMKKLQRDFNQTNRLIDQLRGSGATAEQTLRRLDKASPKELNKTLKLLQQQLNGIQRGTPAWNAQIAKIKAVKAELQQVNAALATQKSMWSRLNSWFNNAQAAIVAVTAALTGLIMAGRKSVQAYADMEEQMANTVKYTRMTAIEVEQLNEIFKNMDTRLAREQLNLLAQEGGRLGYNTVATVKEYVEAASIINVALVDLGAGATQTIAKLSNIFGMEKMYGVRDAMLKIGSTVNHLSQNCTAAKPFLVEFAQRMAGIGSTSKMTIPEILAFAATLDAHGQKVEMSATALQRTIMELFKRPGEMAKKVGLETNTFIETLNKSTTQGVMMFLEALGKLGEDQALAVLSPLFQDLGLDGARVSSVLSNLSSHLDFLKWQLGEASQAFHDGTSASNEYAIFNNTVQASIDKARKRVSELAVELGEKLYPLMKHIYTSSSAFLRVLSKLVTFIVEHRRAITGLITVFAVYYGWLLLSKTAAVAFHAVLGVGRAVHTAYRISLILSRIAAIAFTQGLTAATHAMKLLNAVVKSNPIGLLLSVLTAVILAVVALADRTSEYTKKLREARNTASAFSEELQKEMRNIDTLIGKLEAAEKGTKQYKDVKDEIIKQYGKYLNGLVDEKGEIINLTQAYNRLAAAARIAAKERSLQTARETADETHRESFKEEAKRLQESLVNEGVSLRDAVRITNQVVFQLETTGTLTKELVAELQAVKGNVQQQMGMQDHPVNIVNRMIGQQTEYRETMSAIDGIARENNPLANYTQADLERLIADILPKVEAGKGGRVIIGIDGSNPEVRNLNASELRDFLAEAEARLSLLKTPTQDPVAGNPDFSLDDFTPYESEKEAKKREREEKAKAHRAEVKARKEFREALDVPKGEWEAASAKNVADLTAGLKGYSDFLTEKHRLDIKYLDDRMAIYTANNLEEDEDYQELLKKKADTEAAWADRRAKMKVDDARFEQGSKEVEAQMEFYTPSSALYQNEEALQQKLFDIRITYLKKMQSAYTAGSEEWLQYSQQIAEAEDGEKLRRQKLLAERVAEWRRDYEYLEARKRLDMELALMEEAYKHELMTEEEYRQAQRDLLKKYGSQYLPESAKPKEDSPAKQSEAMARDLAVIKALYGDDVRFKQQYEEAKARIERSYLQKSVEEVRKFGSTHTNQLLDIYEAWQNFFNSTEEDGGNWATRLAALASSVFAVMNAGMQQASEYMQACTDIEIAQTEKKYDREIELAQGNSYKVQKAEQAKEKEIAKLKNEASRKQFAIQVIQAVAQTATNALNAYGSASAVPVVGYILGPIAAAMAVAAGMMQVATIKKQQQAAQAQGYSRGGFTKPGRVDEPAGVVHAGEWVASQKLVNNPRTRPLLEALDYAQRTNTIGSLNAEDVSRSITAPVVLASQRTAQQPVVVQAPPASVIVRDNPRLEVLLNRLDTRLNEPFVTVNTVSGDHGIKRAQEEYDRLMKNKSPKNRI